jgi:signal-transduction protein with cAMP-binding, CBS, and nucleotidyltransferase domain
MKAMPLVPDFPSIQKTLATLPVSVYQQGEIVLAAGSTTGRLLVLRSGAVEVIRDIE